jgi:hypothetical protein
MKRSFRVATAFTGTAAAVAAFAPAAAAATTATAKAQEVKIQEAKIQEIKPDIGVTNCPSSPIWLTSFHFYYPPSGHHGPTCVGEAGTATLFVKYQAWCAGNNRGYFNGYSAGGFGWRVTFGPGSRVYNFSSEGFKEPGPFEVTSIHISGWSGSAKCAW